MIHFAFNRTAVWLLTGICLFARVASAADTDVVLNEIMYHPPDDRDDLQYLELFNRGPAAVDLSHWVLTKGVKFTFLAATRLEPGGYLVVCRNAKSFAEHYGKDIVCVGDFDGQLKHGGERIELANAQQQVIDSLKFSERGNWPRGPDGYSPSLERICPAVPADVPENWSASNWPEYRRPAGTPGKRNDSFSTNLPPVVSEVKFTVPAPEQPATIRATVADADGVKEVALLWRAVRNGSETTETSLPMKRTTGDERRGVFEANLDAQPTGTLVRFRIQATDVAGITRFQPAANESRPSYSYFVFTNTNSAAIPFGFVLSAGKAHAQLPPLLRRAGLGGLVPGGARGNDAFVFVPTNGGVTRVFDHIHVTSRKGGFKLRLHHEQPLDGMTTLNVIFEDSPRYALSEFLSFALYREAGVPAPLSGHIRIWKDGRAGGYYQWIEQPNKAFVKRNGRDDSGNLYKLLWYGNDFVSKHEKKTHLTGGHDDLIQVFDGLNRKQGGELRDFIRQNFNEEEIINYFAASMCIQNWDGFANNYYAYHDTGRTGKWEIYPWDEDKTWGDYDGASAQYDWSEMPLTFGMIGDRPPRVDPRSKANKYPGPFGGVSWWRGPGYFSGKLLAEPEFRQPFLRRLRELCDTVFTEEKFLPVIDALEQRLEPEVRFRAQALKQPVEPALQRFHTDIQSLRLQLKNRREFILSELDKPKE